MDREPVLDAVHPCAAVQCPARGASPDRITNASPRLGAAVRGGVRVTELFCANVVTATATWPTTAAGLVANGTCPFGYSGFPQRECNILGQWLIPIGNGLRTGSGCGRAGAAARPRPGWRA